MLKIAITGSLSSGKSTVSKIISKKGYPVFDADVEVKNFYKNNNNIKAIRNKFRIKGNKNIKVLIKEKLQKKLIKLKDIEKMIHPYVRKNMRKFVKKNTNKNVLVFEIPLLVESKLTKFFDITIFVHSPKKVRIKRFVKKGGDYKIFSLLDKRQMDYKIKSKFCQHVIVNNSSINVLKRKVYNIIE